MLNATRESTIKRKREKSKNISSFVPENSAMTGIMPV
jgi:hypothetical protein